MSEENEIDVLRIEVLLPQSIDQERHAVIRSGVNERRSAALNDQVAGILQWPRVLGIDGKNAIVKLRYLRAVSGQALLGLRCFETIEAGEVFSKKCKVFFRKQRSLRTHHRVLTRPVSISVQSL